MAFFSSYLFISDWASDGIYKLSASNINVTLVSRVFFGRVATLMGLVAYNSSRQFAGMYLKFKERLSTIIVLYCLAIEGESAKSGESKEISTKTKKKTFGSIEISCPKFNFDELQSTSILAILNFLNKIPVLPCFVESFYPVYSCIWWHLTVFFHNQPRQCPFQKS